MSENLTPRQRKAIAALLSQPTIKAAAESCGLGVRTIFRYLQHEPFRQALQESESQAVDEAARMLIKGLMASLSTLGNLMQNADSEAVRRQAASDWITHGLRLLELRTLDNRLTELERQVKQ